MSRSPIESSARLEPADMQRLRHLLGGALAVIAVCGLLPVDNFDALWSVLALGLMVPALVFPGVFAGRGRVFWDRVGLALFAYAVLDLVVSGLTDRQNLLGSVVRVSLVIATLRTMQPRRRREDMQLILMAMFLAAAGGALSLSPLFAAQVFLFIPVSGGVLFLINRYEDTPGAVPPDAHWEAFAWRDFGPRLVRACDWRFGAFLAGAAGVVLVCGAVIFAVLPRFRLDRAVPFLEMPGSGKTGVSEGMSLGGASELSQDESLALRADTPGRVRPILSPYWRLHVLDRYTPGEAESGFSLSPGMGAESTYDSRGSGANWYPSGGGTAQGSPLFTTGDWVVHLESGISRYLPAHGAISRIRFDKSHDWRESVSLRSVRLDKPPSGAMHLQMEVTSDLASHVPAGVELRRLRELTKPDPARYPGTLLWVPEDEASRAALKASLAEAAGDEALTPDNVAAKLTRWLHARHAYALRDGYAVRVARPGQPQDYLVRWMRSGATGWCEHFSGSFVLLAREAGYPARVVSGFAGGEWNDSDSYLLVRMKHAHAWCELFDARSGAWVRVDPTPAGLGVGADGQAAAARRGIGTFSGFAAWYDGVTMLWFRKVVNFEEGDQRQAAKSFLQGLTAWRAALDARLNAWRDAAKAAWERRGEAPREAAPWLVGGVALAALAVWGRRALMAWRRHALSAGGDAATAYVRDCRRRAGRSLVRLDAAAARGRVPPGSLRAAVECVRFGRPAEWGDPEAVLRDAHRWLRG